MAVITISHEMGAGGPEIGMSLAKRLGYRYVDQELIQDAVRRYGLAEEKLSHLDESKPTLFERFDAETRHYITILQTTLLEFAEGDNAVLIGRGGQWLLRGIPHVLRMRRVAPFEQRVQVGLAMDSEPRRQRFTVEAQGGVVTLEGTTALERAVDVARDVPGVKQVRTRQLEIPPIPPFVA